MSPKARPLCWRGPGLDRPVRRSLMSIDLDRRPLAVAPHHELDALRGNWFWFVLLGVALVVLSTVALGSVVITSLAVAAAIGVLLLVGDVAENVWGRSGAAAGAGSSSNCSRACCRWSSASCSSGRR